MSRRIFKEWLHCVLIYFLHRLTCKNAHWRFMADYTHRLLVKICLFGFFSMKNNPTKEKEKKKGKLCPVATWEEKRQSLPGRRPPLGVLCSATHVPTQYFSHNNRTVSARTHSNTTLIRCRRFMLVCCWVPGWVPLCKWRVGKSRVRKERLSQSCGNHFPWERTIAIVLWFAWNNIGDYRWKMPWAAMT